MLHSGPEQETGWRPPNPEFVAFAYELTGSEPAELRSPVMQRIAAVWRGAGTFEERLLATMAAAEKEASGLMMDIVRSKLQQTEYEEHMAGLYFEELRDGIAKAPSEATRKIRTKHLASEIRAFFGRRFEAIDD